MLNLTTTASELSDSESLTDCYQTPPSLAISEHSLVQDLRSFIEELRTSSQVDSPVNRFPTQGSDLEQTTPVTCGPQLSSAFASFDPDTRCWKMSQGWLLADISGPSWETWPKAGLIVDGAFYPQPNWEHRTNEIGSGLWPTIKASDYKRNASASEMNRHSPALSAAVQMWPTPTAVTDTGGAALCKWGGSGARQMMRNNGVSEQELNGALNPNWVEWLMGWPIGWTSLEPLPADSFAQWLDAVTNGAWWPNEPDIPRVAKGVTNRVDRLKALGNGQVSAVVATAWKLLTKD